jgi:hypothetical protein
VSTRVRAVPIDTCLHGLFFPRNATDSQAVMTKDEAEAKAAKVKLTFYRTSVQDNFMVSIQ